MLYLSRLELNPRSRQVQAELRDPYEMHRTLSKAFGEGAADQAAARCLFRVEDEQQGGVTPLLVQSQTPPNWERLTAAAGYLHGPPQVKSFQSDLRSGQTLAFRLRANPTKRLAAKSGDSRLGARVGLYLEAERLAWLARKASENGFALCSTLLIAEAPQACQTRTNKAVFSAARFEGVLRVTEPERMQAALAAGIGAGKGLGFGLLSLASVQ